MHGCGDVAFVTVEVRIGESAVVEKSWEEGTANGDLRREERSAGVSSTHRWVDEEQS